MASINMNINMSGDNICQKGILSQIRKMVLVCTIKYKNMRTKLNRCIYSSGNCNNGQQEYQSSNINAERRIVTCDSEETGK